ncbi:hypothetical protein DL766_001371 [Monosporascus sp. MC13-8B]|uniref:WAP domain-containing protein n=1 Tax=Monosporascus cannonballus TaxID=155416 RepID=A0ABY0HH16_9PEZI|nr:hypothetical protein DL763_005009 [Monosporascus cannonballus]RYO93251.1 hypothetical protein DL762_001200 [Monosporascus cannonballus]RYP37722.1 hypothetical protein DL766_001371 [Monosporascus sp. MC13-8B]
MKASVLITLTTAPAGTSCAAPAPAPTEAGKPTAAEQQQHAAREHQASRSLLARDPRTGGGGFSIGGWGKDGGSKDIGKDTSKDKAKGSDESGSNESSKDTNKDNSKGSDLPVGEAGSLAWGVAKCDTSMTCNSDADCLPGCAAGCVPSADGTKRCSPGPAKPAAAIEQRSVHDLVARDPLGGGLGSLLGGAGKGVVDWLKGLVGTKEGGDEDGGK